jgi:hypothetical protein
MFPVTPSLDASERETLKIKISDKSQKYYNKYYKDRPESADRFDKVMASLKEYGNEDYYDFLNPDNIQKMNKESFDRLKQRAREKKDRLKNDEDIDETKRKNGIKICEECEIDFKDENSKINYDEYLSFCKRKRILDEAKKIAQQQGYLDYKQGNDFIGKLTELLKDRKMAKNIFISFCKIEIISYTYVFIDLAEHCIEKSDFETAKKCLGFAEKYWPESSEVKEIREQLKKREHLIGYAEEGSNSDELHC